MQVNTTLTIYRNYQKIVLQETPGSGPAGRLPRSIEVILLNDLIDIAKPGEAVEVTGQAWLTSTPHSACMTHAAQP